MVIQDTNNRINGIEYLRAFALITLVIWHSICVYTGWQGRLPEITSALSTNEIVKWWNRFAYLFIPDAQMPLFTIISGFVYSYLYHCKNKYKDFKTLVKKKVKRLLIPYFIIGTILLSQFMTGPLIVFSQVKPIIYGTASCYFGVFSPLESLIDVPQK